MLRSPLFFCYAPVYSFFMLYRCYLGKKHWYSASKTGASLVVDVVAGVRKPSTVTIVIRLTRKYFCP